MPADDTRTLSRAPLGPRCAGACRVPGDKSISHRALLFGALCDGVVEASGPRPGRRQPVDGGGAARAGRRRPPRRHGRRAHRAASASGACARRPRALDCGNSGTTIRLLLGLLAGRPFETELAGDASLTRRPMRRVADAAAPDGRDHRRARRSGAPGRRLPAAARPRRRARRHRATSCRSPAPSSRARSCWRRCRRAARPELREPARSRDHTERMLRLPRRADHRRRRDGAIIVDPTGWNGRLARRAAHRARRSVVGDVPDRRRADRPRQRRHRRERRPQPDARRARSTRCARWAPT